MKEFNCPHCNLEVNYFDCINHPGAIPDNDSIGICYRCRGWWIMKDEKILIHKPTKEEEELATREIENSRKRFLNDMFKEKTKEYVRRYKRHRSN